ncbi:hypothetical protein DFH28DRAFT_885410 [Melampsora americana]|nr:hypothetical protein DFH28DRAFT_885410 [Melampsora americana]
MSSGSPLPLSLLSNPKWVENPFREAQTYAISVVNPEFPDWALSVLAFFIIMRVIFVFICAGIIIIPIFKGSTSRKRHYYLVQRVYPGGRNGMPYLVPNRCMIIVVCELVTSVLYMLLGCLNYSFYSNVRSHHGPRPVLMIWYAYLLLRKHSSYVGMVMATWGLCYACLFDVDGTKNKKYSRILTPIVYNSIWITWSLFAIGIISYWAVRSLKDTNDLQKNLHHILALLRKASGSWDLHHDFGKVPIKTILNYMVILFKNWSQIDSTLVRWATVWASLAGALALFYILVVCVLLRMLKQVLRMRDMDTITGNAQWTSTILCELEAEFHFLSRCSFVIILSIFAQIVEAIGQILISVHQDSLYCRITSTIICQIPGVFMVPALLLQSWRIFTERSPDESEFCRVPLDSVTKDVPKLTSLLLGWDTTMCWTGEKGEEEASFPGLRPVTISESSAGGKCEDISSGYIHITQSTVVTRDAI